MHGATPGVPSSSFDDSITPGSPLAPGRDGNAFKPELTGEPDLLVTKQTNSGFYGQPDLHAWLQARRLTGLAVCGIQTNHCVETTARMGGNLGYDVLFVADACHTFDRRGPAGELMTADELIRATVTSLHGEFATVVSPAELLVPPRVGRS
jgi:nicotinamidase-related amidase